MLIDGNGMGSAVGDYDNDGDLDWFVSSTLDRREFEDPTVSRIGNRLYRNTQGVFEDVSNLAKITDGGWGWGACFLDLTSATVKSSPTNIPMLSKPDPIFTPTPFLCDLP